MFNLSSRIMRRVALYLSRGMQNNPPSSPGSAVSGGGNAPAKETDCSHTPPGTSYFQMWQADPNQCPDRQ